MTNMIVLFLIGLGTVLVGSLVFRWAIHGLSSFAEISATSACGLVAAGTFLMFYALPSLINSVLEVISRL